MKMEEFDKTFNNEWDFEVYLSESIWIPKLLNILFGQILNF